MTIKELLKHYKAAPWTNEQEIAAFVAQVPAELGREALVQMLEQLGNKRAAADADAHARRCACFAQLAEREIDRSLFVPYVKALGAADPRVRSLLVQVLPKVNDPKGHPELCGLLRSSDPRVRRAAAEVIKQVGGKTALETLTSLVEQPGFAGRSEAMDALMPIAGHYAIPALHAVVRLGTPEEQIKALKFLGDRHYMAKAMPRALKAILSGFAVDGGPALIAQAVISFSSLATEDAYFNYVAPYLDTDNAQVERAAVWGLRHFSSPQVINALERKLRCGANLIQMEALSSLEAIGDASVLPPLVAALSVRNVAIRTRAGEVLSRLSQQGKLEVSRVIIWLLRSRDVNVRRMAVEIARSIKNPDADLWPKLIAMLRDEDWWVRERVTDVLVEMAGKDLIPHIAALLSDPSDVVRRFAVEVLGRLGDADVLGALIGRVREDSDWWVREKAVEAMVRLKDPRAVPYIVETMRADAEIRLACVQALLDLNAREMSAHVVELLADEDCDVRHAALRALKQFGATEHAASIQPLLADPVGQVSRFAQELLIHWNIELNNDFLASRSKAGSFLDRMLTAVAEAKGDDLILASRRKPYIKKLGKVVPLSSTEFSAEQIRALLTPQLSLAQMEQLDAAREVDFSYDVKNSGLRFRVNVFHQHGGIGAVFRIIKGELTRLEELGLPRVVHGFSRFAHGLVLFGGPTGSGKSTSLAAIIDDINRNSDRHVISLEDPIEVVHASQKGLVNQREVGTHTQSFTNALRSTLRQDPDVILVGEMRDLQTISFAVTAAETGHLIFGTVHTVSADTSVDRLINAFPATEQDQVRATLAENLRAVVCQYLIKRKEGNGRVLATEVMLNSDAIAAMVRKGKTYQIPSVIATSAEQGMQLMDNQLMRLFREGVISAEEAYMRANVKKDFEEIFAEEKKNVSASGTGLAATAARAASPQPQEPSPAGAS